MSYTFKSIYLGFLLCHIRLINIYGTKQVIVKDKENLPMFQRNFNDGYHPEDSLLTNYGVFKQL